MRRFLVLLLAAAVSCVGGSASSDDSCDAGEVLRGGLCVRLCNADGECASGTICNAGTCEAGVRPEVVAASPVPDATDVPADANIVLTFSTPMEPSTTATAFLLVGAAGPVAGATEWNDTNLAMTFDPAEDLLPGGGYTAQLVTTAVSAEGIPMADRYELAFTVYLPPLTVVAMTPTPGSDEVGINPLISITFSVPMEPTSARASAHLLAPGGLDVSGNEMFNADNTVWTFIPGSNLAYDATYTVRVDAGAESAAGAALAEQFEGSFATTAQADGTPPVITINTFSFVVSGPELDGFESFTFTGTASDGETEVEQVYAQVVPAGQGPGTWAPATFDGVNWSYRWFTGTLTPPPDGFYTIYARAVDKGANETSANEIFEADLAPPDPPTFVTPPPTSWKFTNLDLQIQSEVGATVELLLDGGQVSGSPFDADLTGQVAVRLELMALGDHPIVVVAIDEHGNRSTALGHIVTKVAYDCLVAANGFPAGGAQVIGGIDDDGSGNVTLTYELDSGYAEDAYIYAFDPTSNYGSSSQLTLDSNNSVLLRYSDLLIPGCAEITSAKINIYEVSTTYSSNEQIQVYPLLRAWIENDVDWNDATDTEPWEAVGAIGTTDAGNSIGGAVYTDSSPDFAAIEVTLTARDWLDGTTSNQGILLRTSDNMTFYSSETGSYPPRLELILREPE